ncbi:HlyD family type I secretion periplasmic adaptor subunit [Vibrio caribbeanicus]|uniref:HlyD family type I secretion periplasmic adaptor subunit n=1 Tax=Vibrio caribbeanicus TaxID=701175 RepID=UPI0030DC5A9C
MKENSDSNNSGVQLSMQRYLFVGMLALIFGLGGFVLWSVSLKIDGAVVASGQISVEAKQQAVQHPDGGIVKHIYVREGAFVEIGEPLLLLDGASLHTQQTVLKRKRVEARARIERLFGEISGSNELNYSPKLIEMGTGIEGFEEILTNEKMLFDARKTIIDQTKTQSQIRQTRTENVISGLQRQLAATKKQLKLTQKDLDAQERLQAQEFASKTQIRVLYREAAKHESELGQIEASIAESRNTIADPENEWLRQKTKFLEDAQSELQELQVKQAELIENIDLNSIKLPRLVLRAPMSGRVLGLSANTIGGVIQAGTEIANIVPSSMPLVVNVRIDPLQIDRVSIGQEVRFRYPSLNAVTTPEVYGKIKNISADVISDPNSGASFFTAEITLDEQAKQDLAELELVPGMLVDAFIRTDERTPASFLLKPIFEYWMYSMREE